MKKTHLSRFPGYIAVFVGLFLLIYFRFHRFCPTVFYGDDLANYFFVRHLPTGDANLDALMRYIGTKFRPVFSLMLTAEMLSFGKHLQAYLLANFVIAAASGLVAFVVFWRLARDRAIAIALSAVVMTSRFALYQTTQVTGQVESIPFFFFVCVIFFAWHAVHEDDVRAVRRYEWMALFLAIFAFHSHERYIVLLPWLIVAFVLTRKSVGVKHRAMFFAVAICTIVANILVKKLFLHASFLEGTGGTNISISIPNIIDLGKQAILSIFGLNWGGDYLIGADWRSLPIMARIAGMIFCLLSIASIAFVLRKVPRKEGALASFPILLVLCAAMLLAPAMATIRMEQRWEMAPFFILLCLVAMAAARAKEANLPKRALYAGVGILLFAQTTSDLAVTPAFPKMAIQYEAAFARSVKDVIVSHVSAKNVYVIGDYSHCNWALLDNRGFFIFYENSNRTATCVQSISEIPDDGAPVFVTESRSKLVDVTDMARHQRSHQKESAIDLLDKFGEAVVLNKAPEDTPTRAGVFVWNDADWPLGHVRTLTILSTHGVEYPNLRRAENASLEMSVGMMFPTKSFSEVVVTVKPESGLMPPRTIELRLPILQQGAMRRTADFKIQLPELAKGNASVSVSVATPSGDLNSAWVGFTYLGLSCPSCASPKP